MADLTYEEFRKLPESLQGDAYARLSDHDKFIARISEPSLPEVVGYVEITKEEEIADSNFFINELLKRKVITPEDVVIVDGVPTIKKS